MSKTIIEDIVGSIESIVVKVLATINSMVMVLETGGTIALIRKVEVAGTTFRRVFLAKILCGTFPYP